VNPGTSRARTMKTGNIRNKPSIRSPMTPDKVNANLSSADLEETCCTGVLQGGIGHYKIRGVIIHYRCRSQPA